MGIIERIKKNNLTFLFYPNYMGIIERIILDEKVKIY
jgi:hypothetical protein